MPHTIKEPTKAFKLRDWSSALTIMIERKQIQGRIVPYWYPARDRTLEKGSLNERKIKTEINTMAEIIGWLKMIFSIW